MRPFVRALPLVVALGVAAALWPGSTAAQSNGPPRESNYRGGATTGVRIEQTTNTSFATSKSHPQLVTKREVRVPHGAQRLAVVTVSAVCSHTGGDSGDYTAVDVYSRSHGLNHPPLDSESDVFCSDLGDGSDYRSGVSRTWTMVLDEGFHKVVVRYASAGAGTAHLVDVVLVVNLYKRPCGCP